MKAGVLPFRLRQFWFVIAALALSAAEVRGDYPRHGTDSVADSAHLLTASDAATLRSEIASFKARTGAELVVFTLPSYLSLGTADASFESFATRLFNRNGIGDAGRNDGLMLLVAKAERKIRIETGTGYGRSLDAPMKAVIDTVMTPRFKAGNFSGGILEGARALMRGAQTRRATAATQPAPRGETSAPQRQSPPPQPASPRPVVTPPPGAQPPAERFAEAPPGYTPRSVQPERKVVPRKEGKLLTVNSPPSPWRGVSSVVLVVLALGSVALLLWLRCRRAYCEQCRVKMLPLSETEDDQHLQPGQVREEQLGSVNYEVLSCPSCRGQKILKRARWFSGFSHCPRCGNKTLTTTSVILVQPTHTRTGKRQTSSRCHHCSHRSESTSVMPMLQNSSAMSSFSSSSGSGFSGGGSSSGGHSSGGHSSGGGASGGW